MPNNWDLGGISFEGEGLGTCERKGLKSILPDDALRLVLSSCRSFRTFRLGEGDRTVLRRSPGPECVL